MQHQSAQRRCNADPEVERLTEHSMQQRATPVERVPLSPAYQLGELKWVTRS